jgi:succinate-semialdehyde dehydrogenase/glutarate-semialdehyde dehydrogenase
MSVEETGSGDPNRAWRLAMRMEAGSVMINDMAVTYGLPEAPFGGVKASGVGRVNGTDGLRGYCQSVPVITNRFKMKTLPAAYPYGIQKVATLRKTIRFLWASGLGRWFQ